MSSLAETTNKLKRASSQYDVTVSQSSITAVDIIEAHQAQPRKRWELGYQGVVPRVMSLGALNQTPGL